MVEGSPADWRVMVDLNIMGVLLAAHATMAALRKRRGTLVLAGSVDGVTKWFVHGVEWWNTPR